MNLDVANTSVPAFWYYLVLNYCALLPYSHIYSLLDENVECFIWFLQSSILYKRFCEFVTSLGDVALCGCVTSI